jgi:hypothetical protein
MVPETNKTEDTNKLTAVTRSWIAAMWRSILKVTFADGFQKFYERCQRCVVKDDDDFEGQ